MLKTVVLHNIFVETMVFVSGFFDTEIESSNAFIKNKNISDISLYCHFWSV